MNSKDKEEFSAFLAGIAEVYQKKFTDAAIMIYFETLKDLSLAQIKSAVKSHLEDSKEGSFLPLPAQIRSRACPKSSPILAWALVERTIFSHDAYATVQFEDGTINAVIRDLGGWVWLCNQDIDEPWTQKEFERRYEAYKQQGVESHEPLVGLFEVDNRGKGLLEWVPETALIGNGGEVKALPPRFEKQIGPAQDELVKSLADKMKM